MVTFFIRDTLTPRMKVSSIDLTMCIATRGISNICELPEDTKDARYDTLQCTGNQNIMCFNKMYHLNLNYHINRVTSTNDQTSGQFFFLSFFFFFSDKWLLIPTFVASPGTVYFTYILRRKKKIYSFVKSLPAAAARED